MKRRFVLTGASGFLGTALTQSLVASGADVLALSRRPITVPGVQWQAYELGEPVPPTSLAGCTAVIHAAFSMERAGPALERKNIEAAQRLVTAAHALQRPFIFISSMSAHAEAASSYGRAKWAIEQLLDPAVDSIVRPGLIVGPGGLYARMAATLRRAPLLPIFYGGNQPIQPVGLDDLVEALVRITRQSTGGTYNLGSPAPITVRELYGRMLAAMQLRRRLVSLPGDFTLHSLQFLERLGLRLPVTAENLRGQKHLRAFETADSFVRLGLAPTPLDRLPWAVSSPSS